MFVSKGFPLQTPDQEKQKILQKGLGNVPPRTEHMHNVGETTLQGGTVFVKIVHLESSRPEGAKWPMLLTGPCKWTTVAGGRGHAIHFKIARILDMHL